ncbi:MAG: sensor histidine kinase, partial [Candidatus Limnocylindria bacterium]
VVPLFVLAAAGVFLPWLIAEAHRAIRAAAGADRDLVSERQVSGELRRAQNVREEYMSVLAHELRNPLIGIEAAARTFLDRSDAGAAEATAAGIAVETRHALDLIDGLTDVASLETGRMRLALRSIDLASLLRETATATDTRDHPVVLRGADAPVQVHADEHRIGQVIRNLVANAARYSAAGTVVEVDLGLTRDRRSAVVKVRDSGPGIPPAERGRLFQKFARLSTAGATRGSGLGLYICKGIVDDHGGELSADWPPGGGSVFSFTLPVADP